ncbi:MoaB/Mog domain-containing protein [Thamnocephalis sphaerospora]|uniref:MoaB/Mog domain-containing protein n=1 Tax=Thamnocephalis sphaerospora TaxID=78915 RepID=A0A4P9XGY7_9FUNG|nr:MoaB/Mog domain-containing protein [Thamnocephalis sphaerospora]|eukprot:RKP04925.1 MoaB/Mog domain-containing protein [Thamnocephalis sphaerospora]
MKRYLGGKASLTAAACIIGDEVLNGKTRDSNSHYLANWCFRHGVDLRRVEVIPDDAADIGESVRRLASRFDLVYTSGGIGPTHDDITYEAIANAYGLPLAYHAETLCRMRERITPTTAASMDEDVVRNRERMALLPVGDAVHIHYAANANLWTPVVIIGHQVHILPGVPALFERLLESLPLPAKTRGGQDVAAADAFHRVLIGTPRTESHIAEALRAEQARVCGQVKIGSYPRWHSEVRLGQARVVVALVGRDKHALDMCAQRLLPLVDGVLLGDPSKEDARAEGSSHS